MGGSLGPVLANIIMTEFEKVVVRNLIKTGIVKFYARYVDDTLLVIKWKDISFYKSSIVLITVESLPSMLLSIVYLIF